MSLQPILLSLLIMGWREQTATIGASAPTPTTSVINHSGSNSSNQSATTDLAVPVTTTEVPSVVVRIDLVKAREVNISWTNPASGILFRVNVIKLQGRLHVSAYLSSPATFALLTPDTEYRVTVQAQSIVNGAIRSLGEPGEAIFRTEKVPNTPAMPIASRITHNSVTVQWSYLESDWNGPSGHFIVELDQTANRTVPASQRSIGISNLSPAKEYAVRLLAENENGQGDWSVRLTVFTHPLPWLMLNKSILQEPANGDGTTDVVIGWSKPDFWPNSAFEYDVTVTGDAQLSSRVSEPRVTVPQVKPYSSLTVSVTPIIYGNNSYSHFRRSRNYRTKAAKPGTPIVGVTVDFVGSAVVSWNSLQYNDHSDNVVAILTLTRLDISSKREIRIPQKSLTESQHRLTNMGSFLFYKVTLTVKNSIGSSTSNAVTFRSHATTPSASGEISISNVTSSSAIVSWNTILYNDAVELVTVFMSLTNLNTGVKEPAFRLSLNDRRLRSHTLNGLSTFVRYRVDLDVANSQTSGTSSLRKTVSFMTPLPATTNLAVPVTTTEVPSAVVTIDRVKAREVNISWTNLAGGTFFKVTVTTMQVQTPVNAYLSSPVTLAPLTPDTEYRVTVQVQGIVNGVIRSLGKPGEATFRTEKVPNTPATPIASRITHNSATVQWSYLESDWNGPSGHFIVELDQTANRTVPASLRSIDISNLSPAKEYAIRLLAKNENGQGDWSVRLTVFTHPLPKVTLEDVLSYPSKMASRFATDVVLRWSIPREWISNSALIKFNVTVHRNGKEMSWTSDSNQLLIKDVPGFSEMHVYVFPVVLGHPHEELGAKQTYLTQTLAPFKPEGLKVIPGQYSAVVVWNEWEINDNLSTVIARYTLNNTHATGRISADDLCARRFNLTELQPFTSYRLAVRVINKIDESSPVTHHFKTLAAGAINQSGSNSSNESATTDLAVPLTTTEVPSAVVTVYRVKGREVNISWTNPAGGTHVKVIVKSLQGQIRVNAYLSSPATLAPLTPDTEYRVTVQVQGIVNGAMRSLGKPGEATFRTAKVPNTPAVPVASQITHNSATVQWSYLESDWNGPSGHFIVELDQTADRTVPASQRSIDISNLSPAREYAVRLLAKNENGQGDRSVRLTVFTHPLPWLMLNKSILQEPANGDGTSDVVIGWSKPDFWPNSAFEYDVTVTGDAQLSSRVSEPRVTVPQVKPYSSLTVSVTPIIYGNTSYSHFRTSRNYRTKAAKPGTPIVGVTVDFVGSALVSWNSLQYNDNPDNVVANLTLTRIDVSSRREIPMPQKSLAESQHLLRNLDAFVFYEVMLTVKNSIGSSTSNAVTFRSHATTPSASGEISISNVTSNSAIVSWNTILYNDAVEKVTVSMSLTNLNASVEGRAFPVSRNDRHMRSRTLNGLSAFVRYRVDLNVANSQTSGTSSLRKTVSFMTPLPDQLPNPPSSVVVVQITHQSAQLNWEFSDRDWNGAPAGVIVVKNTVTGDRLELSPDTKSTNLSGLKAATSYEVEMTSQDKGGRMSKIISTIFNTSAAPKVTLENVLSYPSKTASRFATDVILRWSIPTEWISNSALIKYNVTVRRNGKEMSWTSDNNQRQITAVPGFSEMHVYVFPVVLGLPHEELGDKQTYLTKPLAPFKPEGLKVIPGQYSAVVVWNEWEINDNLSTVDARYTLNNTHASGRISADDLRARRFNLTELQPFTSYRLAVRVLNEVDESSPVTHHFKTLAAVPSALVGRLRARSIFSKKVVIEWDHISQEDWRGANQMYAICYTAGTSAACSDKTPWNCALKDEWRLIPPTFTANKLKPASVYTFCVAAESSGGRGGYEKISITTEEAGPSKPLDVAAVAMSFNTLNVSWKMPKVTNGKLTGYRVTIKGNSWVFLLASNELSVVISGLDGGTNYTIDVEGKTGDDRWGDKASIHKVTPEGKPEKAPENVVALNISWSSIRVKWSPPGPPHHGKIIKYMLTWNTSEPQNSTVVQVNGANEGKLSHDIQHLLRDTFYKVSVKAGTQRGYGPAADMVVQTDTEVPGHVLHLNTSLVTARAVSLTWRRPHDFGGQSVDVHYKITYKEPNTNKSAEKTHKSDDAAIVYNVTGLLAYTDYDFFVTVVNRRHSGPSRHVQSRTAVAAPSSPRNVMVEPRNMLNLTIYWQMPTNLSGPKETLSYMVTLSAKEDVHVDSDKYLKMARVDQLVNTEWKVPRHIQPYTQYTISVIAVQQNMTSLSSRPAKRIVEVRNREFVPALPPLPEAPTKPGPDNTLSFVIKRSSDHGFASFYLVGVRARKTGGQPRTRRQSSKDELQYIAAKIKASDIPEDGLEFTLGDGKKYNSETNEPLIGGYSYQFRLGVLNPEDVVAWAAFSDTVDIPPTIAPPRTSPPGKPSPKSDNTGIIIAAIVVGVLLALLLVILVMLLWKRYKNQRVDESTATGNTKGHEKSRPEFIPPIPEPSLARRSPGPTSDSIGIIRGTKKEAMQSYPPIPISKLSLHIADLKTGNNVTIEYEAMAAAAVDDDEFTCNHSNMPINRAKNRYSNIQAYDHSRVRLNAVRGQAGSDYINANLCDGHNTKNAYIATQGPLEETQVDFWRMIWEQRTATVVMLTNLEERGKPKCSQYWPSSGTNRYGTIDVTLVETVQLADYTVRVFSLAKANRDLERREVKQFHFTAWQDQSVPRTPTSMLAFQRKVRLLNPSSAGPIVVHCSAGVGRTGTFMAIDSMLMRAKEMDTIDVFGYITVLRTQRMFMVQTPEQYEFIYDALLEALECGNTDILAKDLKLALQRLNQPVISGDSNSLTAMEIEFQRLEDKQLDDNRFIAATRDVNIEKNRFVDERFLPYDDTRVRLRFSGGRGQDGGDYINASYIDGYQSTRAFVAAQSPLKETEQEFWQMVWESQAKIIVMLTDLVEENEEACHRYWPQEGAHSYGPFLVDSLDLSEQSKTDSSHQVVSTLRQFKLTNTEGGQTRTICQFQYCGGQCWPTANDVDPDESSVITGMRSLIDLIGEVQKLQEHISDQNPVVVHCNTGVGRTGCFIALSIILERMRCELLLDVFQTVRAMRSQRPFLVQTLGEYKFIYNTALHYLTAFEHFIDAGEAETSQSRSVGVTV